MKKLLAILISLSLFISLTACGGSTPAENGGEGAKPNTQTTQQGGSENSGQNGGAASADISSVSVENYAEIVKKAFGIEIVLDDGWTVTKASSPNGVNNIIVTLTAPADTSYSLGINCTNVDLELPVAPIIPMVSPDLI